MPYATSLRMGPLGYQSDAQSSLAVSYNCLQSYARFAAGGADPAVSALRGDRPARRGDDYRQLSTTLLQIENEFYGTIRPKQPIRPGERPLHALARARRRVRRSPADGPRSVQSDRHHRRRPSASSTSSCCTACSATARPTARALIEILVAQSQRRRRARPRSAAPADPRRRRAGRASRDWGRELLRNASRLPPHSTPPIAGTVAARRRTPTGSALALAAGEALGSGLARRPPECSRRLPAATTKAPASASRGPSPMRAPERVAGVAAAATR